MSGPPPRRSSDGLAYAISGYGDGARPRSVHHSLNSRDSDSLRTLRVDEDVSSLREELEKTQRQLQATMQLSRSAQSQIEKLQADHAKSAERLASTRNHYQSQVTDLSEELKAKNDKIQSLRHQRNQAQGQRDTLEKGTGKLKGKWHATVAKMTLANQERDEANKHAQISTSQLEDLSRNSAAHDSTIKALRQKFDKARKQRDAYGGEAAKLDTKLKAAVSKVAVLSRELDEANGRADNVIAQSEAQHAELTQKCSVQKSESKALRWRYDKARDDRDAFRREVLDANDKLKATRAKVATLTKERNDANERVQTTTAQLEAQRAELSLISRKSAQLESDLKSLRRRYDKARDDRDEFRRRGGETDRELKAALERSGIANQKLGEVKQNTETLTTRFLKQHTELSRKCASQEVQLKTLSEDLGEANRQLTRSRIKRGELQDQIYDLEEALNKKGVLLESVCARLQRSEGLLQSAQAEITRLSSDVNLKALNVDVLLEQLDRSKRKLEEIQEKGDEVDALREELSLLRMKPRPEACLSGGPPDDPVPPQECTYVAHKPLDDDLTLPASDLTSVADDAQPPKPIHRFQGELQQFNMHLSDTAAKLSVWLNPSIYAKGWPSQLTILEKFQKVKKIEDARIRPLARFLAQHSLALWSRDILEGRDTKASNTRRTEDTDITVLDPDFTSHSAGHRATVEALDALTKVLSIFGLTMNRTTHDAYKLVYPLFCDASKLRTTMVSAKVSESFSLILPSPGIRFADDEMWDVGDQFTLDTPANGTDDTELVLEGIVAGAIGFGLQCAVPRLGAETAQMELVLEPHVVLDYTVQLLLG